MVITLTFSDMFRNCSCCRTFSLELYVVFQDSNRRQKLSYSSFVKCPYKHVRGAVREMSACMNPLFKIDNAV